MDENKLSPRNNELEANKSNFFEKKIEEKPQIIPQNIHINNTQQQETSKLEGLSLINGDSQRKSNEGNAATINNKNNNNAVVSNNNISDSASNPKTIEIENFNSTENKLKGGESKITNNNNNKREVYNPNQRLKVNEIEEEEEIFSSEESYSNNGASRDPGKI